VRNSRAKRASILCKEQLPAPVAATVDSRAAATHRCVAGTHPSS